MSRSRTVIEWEADFSKHMQEYPQFRKFLEEHVRLLEEAVRDLTERPKPKQWLYLAQQEAEKALPSSSPPRISQRKSKRANPLLRELRGQIEEMKTDLGKAIDAVAGLGG